MRIVEEVPDGLREEVRAALAWLNAKRGRSFAVTGVVDPELAERARGATHHLTLILCDGDLCVREQVRVRPIDSGFEVSGSDAASGDPPPELDPKPGARLGWLDAALARSGRDDVGRRAAFAMLKLGLFAAGWIGAFVLLSVGWVAFALVVYAAIAAPGIVEAQRAFQSVEA
jgi:hypothetical protein